MTTGSALPKSRNPFHAGVSFRGFTGSLPLRPARLLAPLHGSDWDAPALGDFYFQAFDRSVSLPVAGYNYNSDWTPLLAGLSPAGMAASLAARSWRDEFGAIISRPQHLSSAKLMRLISKIPAPIHSIT